MARWPTSVCPGLAPLPCWLETLGLGGAGEQAGGGVARVQLSRVVVLVGGGKGIRCVWRGLEGRRGAEQLVWRCQGR